MLTTCEPKDPLPVDSALSQPPRHQLSAGSGQNLGSALLQSHTNHPITFNPTKSLTKEECISGINL